MKSFVLAAALGASAVNAASRSFVEGVGQNGTSGQFVRLSSPSTVDVFQSENLTGGTEMRYKLTSWGVFYEDSGAQKVRLEHKLYADIFATDKVMFEVAFRPKSMGAPTDRNSIGEDYMACEMQQSTTDAAYWSASVSEGYYVCNDTLQVDDTDVCLGISASDDNYDKQNEGQSDWATPYTDDGLTGPEWCTKAYSSGSVRGPFECSALKCVAERSLDTGDAVNDLAFSPTPGSPDYMVIQPGRARVYINKSDSAFAFPVSSDAWIRASDSSLSPLELKISVGATSLMTSAVAVAALAVTLFSF